MNLVSNACKFTTSGSVFVHVTSRTVQSEGERPRTLQLELRVRDTGPGMTAAQSAQLFVPFSQVDSGTRDQRAKGTGLGLYIAQQLARLMGGDIAVHSRPGTGTEFVATLQAELPHRGSTPTLRRSSLDKSWLRRLACARIALVAPSADLRAAYEGRLRTFGADVLSYDSENLLAVDCVSCRAAWRRPTDTAASQPDLVVLVPQRGSDIAALVRDAQQVTPGAQLLLLVHRRDEALAQNLDVALLRRPARAERVAQRAAQLLSALDAIRTPPHRDTPLPTPRASRLSLSSTVSDALPADGTSPGLLRRAPSAAALSAASLAASTDSSTGAHVLVVDDSAVNRMVAGALCARLGNRVTLAEDGATAVRLACADHAQLDAVLMDLHMPVLVRTACHDFDC
jgi:hypothetical protein